METQMERVSILVRTCGRPHILRKTLESIRKQTYENIEVVIVEDGANMAQRMLEEEFSDLNIKYQFTGYRRGRTVVGNMAMATATGRYYNFLDDDDIIFPDHIEELVKAMQGKKELAAYSVAYESVVKYDEKRREYKEYKRKIRYRQPFNRVFLSFNNYIPIQSILFDRALYERLGGLDENLDLLEDWDLWVRYSTETDFIFVDKITSLYRVPKNSIKRDCDMSRAYENVVAKYRDYKAELDMYRVNKDLEYVLEVIKTPKWKRALKKVRDKVLYR